MDSMNPMLGGMLYGRARRRELTGEERALAELHGYIPSTYQCTKWFVIIFFPVIPVGTYRAIRSKDATWLSDPGQMVRIGLGWKQIFVHYLIGYGWIGA